LALSSSSGTYWGYGIYGTRGLFIGEYLYVFSGEYLDVFNLESLEGVASLEVQAASGDSGASSGLMPLVIE
jgi:hypothetical protein